MRTVNVGMASHKALSFVLVHFSETYGSDPIGVQHCDAPDCHTSAPSPRCSSVESRLCSMLSSCFGANGSRRL